MDFHYFYDMWGLRGCLGNSSNTVDAEMSVLRYRIEQVRMKERSNTRSNLIHGWNYRPGYDVVKKKPSMLLTSIQLASIVGRTVGLVFFSGSLCIFLVSLIFHHGQIK
ncbi:hypothetical protein CDL12_13057 [Handroanthus impetiginosus]|uniref:Uncharacterized protein n=1 Tax=Handroanthus impetiginosus TaxID=429701 RepID=A0A2G9H9Y3_9LAMI|nr:hypothetical protein CDL12_13057 [Handroanthus impetiginosus]